MQVVYKPRLFKRFYFMGKLYFVGDTLFPSRTKGILVAHGPATKTVTVRKLLSQGSPMKKGTLEPESSATLRNSHPQQVGFSDNLADVK